MSQPKLMVLLGEFTAGCGLEAYLRRHHFGRMWARDPVKFETPGELCGFDCGAYGFWKAGKPFDEGRFLARLDQLKDAIGDNLLRCILGVVPDLPAQGLASLRYSMWWREKLELKIPWYLAIQDGMDSRSVKNVIHEFDGLFLGGTDKVKRQAKFWCDLAHHHGKFFHYARCSTVARLRDAIDIGANSVDSSLPVINWNMGEKKRAVAKRWLNVAMGRDRQLVLPQPQETGE